MSNPEFKLKLMNQLRQMLTLQDTLNSKVDDDWIANNNNWNRAIWLECGELVEHHGWKWWKKQDCDIEQVKIEVIDILHFGLSQLLQLGMTVDDTALRAAKDYVEVTGTDGDLSIIELTELIAEDAINGDEFDISKLIALSSVTGMSFDDLYSLYVAKNILNIFRQNNGYKEGTYVKEWFGEEDNVYLEKYMASEDHDAVKNEKNYIELLYAVLTKAYAANATADTMDEIDNG